jgi:hypothetical protein
MTTRRTFIDSFSEAELQTAPFNYCRYLFGQEQILNGEHSPWNQRFGVRLHQQQAQRKSTTFLEDGSMMPRNITSHLPMLTVGCCLDGNEKRLLLQSLQKLPRLHHFKYFEYPSHSPGGIFYGPGHQTRAQLNALPRIARDILALPTFIEDEDRADEHFWTFLDVVSSLEFSFLREI